MTTLIQKTLGVSLLCGLLLVGCNDKPQPKPDQKTETKETQSSNQTPSPVAQCDDIAAKNSLVKALSFATNEEIVSLMANYNNADKLGLARRTQERLGQLSLDLQNIQVDGDACTAEMVVVVPNNDLGHAKNHYKASGKPNIDELAQSHSVSIEEGRISSTIHYTVKNGQATLSDIPQALAFIADLMSASAYHMAQGEGRVNTSARPAVKVQPAKPAEVARPQPVVREPNLTNQEQQNDLPATNADTNNGSSTNTTTENTVSEQPAKKEPVQRESVKKEPAFKDSKPVPEDDSIEIAIVETDETY